MAYDFKNLNAVEVQNAPTENTTVMAFENGSPKQIPAKELGSKAIVFDIDFNNDIVGKECTLNYDPIYEAVTNGSQVILRELYPISEIESVTINEYVVAWTVSSGKGIYFYTAKNLYDGVLFTNGSYHTAT